MACIPVLLIVADVFKIQSLVVSKQWIAEKQSECILYAAGSAVLDKKLTIAKWVESSSYTCSKQKWVYRMEFG